MKRVEKFLIKLKELFLAENAENQKMLDTYIRFAEGKATDEESAKGASTSPANACKLVGAIFCVPQGNCEYYCAVVSH